ncbi:MAG: hypothetical protein WCD12_06890 [Candidatus Binatus sp.]|jgi:hypothetical protein|uniref:hypothetical protein n=1 Tax=Candidatus Binatus sp. TaxID=2811406 RepID=UPI003C774437
MKCVLCAKTSIEVKIDPFPLSPEARDMLQELCGINPARALANHAICRECFALPFAERNKLADKANKSEQNEYPRHLSKDAVKRWMN